VCFWGGNLGYKEKKKEMEEERGLKRDEKEIGSTSSDRDRYERLRRYREILVRDAKIKASSVSIYRPSCKNRRRVDKLWRNKRWD
jgi:hypothetical protein